MKKILSWIFIIFYVLLNIGLSVFLINNNSKLIVYIPIAISLLSPVLTFVVFQNTLNIQSKQIKKDDKSEVDKFFNSLLDLFLKRQKDNGEVKYIVNILGETKYNFINNYGYREDYTFEKPIGTLFQVEGENRKTIDYISVEKYSNSLPPEKIRVDKCENKTHVLNKQYKSIYNFSGPYFKVVHRILKILNDSLEAGKITEKDYKMYIGILRTQLSSEEFTFILFNSIYITRGIGLGIQLVGSGLFGDQTDFEINQHFPTPNEEKKYLKLFEITAENLEIRKELVDKFEELKKDSDKFKKTYSFADFYNSIY